MHLWRSGFYSGWLCALPLLFSLLPAPLPAAEPGPLRPAKLLCEYEQNPLGVDAPRPGLSWTLESIERNQRQSAYQILVASKPSLLAADKADLWDSGPVKSSDSLHVPYGGQNLSSRQLCCWKVRVWNQEGMLSDWSEPALWEMGLLRQEDWVGGWIGSGPAHEPRPASGFFTSTNELAKPKQAVKVDGQATLLRKEFVVDKPVARARVYVTGLGYYEFHCNGRRVGDRVLAPAKSNYRKWILYDMYDVAELLQRGTNALGLMLGNGWFNPYEKWWDPYRMQWFGSKRALLQLHIDYVDGSSRVIASDASWKTASGPVTYACIYDGEMYDATLERPGWDQPGCDESGWAPVNVVEAPGGLLRSQLMPGIKVVERVPAVSAKSPKPGVYVFDFGQNFSGWARLAATGPKGTRILLRYAEDLLPNGNLDPTSNERAAATNLYVMKGGGLEVYEPRFTFHGFRYVEVTGFPGVPQLTNLTGCVVHTACERTGSFECGNDLINRIHRATIWSQRSNLMGYPMDCPQRDERLGWFGDALVSMEEAMCNFDMPLFYRHWLDGVKMNQNETNGDISIISPRPYLADEPDPTWSSAYIVMVWGYYVHYGDREFLARQFDCMRRYVDYLGTQATNCVLPKYWIGDWGTIVEGWKEGEPVSVNTAFYYYDSLLVSKAARVLGKRDEAEKYAALAQAIRTAFNRTFYHPDTQQYDQGTEFSNAFPLFLGLVDRSSESAVLQNVLSDLRRGNGRFNVGVLGAKYLIDALTQFGRADVAYQLANQTGYPSWGHMLEGGRTTLSEFWDLHGSHNHVMMGSIDGWFYRALAGIQPDENRPGFEHIIIKPFVPETLPFVRARVQTVRGPVSVEWEQSKAELKMRVTIPPNSSATVHVPAASAGRVQTAPRLERVRFENRLAVYTIGSGSYEFRVGAGR